MNRHLDVEPTTDAALFDMLHGLFGVGDYVEDDPKPYHRFRMIEISKIKAMRKKRGIALDQLACTARYLYRRGGHVRATYGLVEHMGPALRERALARQTAVRQQMLTASDEARALGQDGWADRLLLAQGSFRAEVLQQWQQWRTAHKAGASCPG